MTPDDRATIDAADDGRIAPETNPEPLRRGLYLTPRQTFLALAGVLTIILIGMGGCQGRYCQLAGAELIAARAGISVCNAGRLREQAPVRPVPIGAWIGDG